MLAPTGDHGCMEITPRTSKNPASLVFASCPPVVVVLAWLLLVTAPPGFDGLDQILLGMAVGFLASLASVRAAAKRFLGSHERLDLLVNNAGVMATPFGRTADGFELQLGTNHLGHFLLTSLLAPALLAATPARIVNLTSGGHMISDVHWDDPNFERHDYDKWAAYGQSKTANVLFTIELDLVYGTPGVVFDGTAPGFVLRSGGLRSLAGLTVVESRDVAIGALEVR